jgi:hypothetical protein
LELTTPHHKPLTKRNRTMTKTEIEKLVKAVRDLEKATKGEQFSRVQMVHALAAKAIDSFGYTEKEFKIPACECDACKK